MSVKDKIFLPYLDMAKTLGEMFSPVLETVVHDFTNPDKSIIAIYNGHVTGRKCGDGITDVDLKRIKGQIPDQLVNYKNESPTGKQLKSSTLAIRDHNNKVVGSFGLNLDVSYFLQMEDMLRNISQGKRYEYLEEKERFFFYDSKEQVQDVFQAYISEKGLYDKSLNKEEKADVIKNLYEKGIFNIKGSISEISRLLGVTRVTVYNHLKKLNVDIKLK